MTREYQGKYSLLDTSGLKRYAIGQRQSKVHRTQFGQAEPAGSLMKFIDSLPQILKGAELRELVAAMVTAVRDEKAFMVSMGAHVIKCGLSPLLIRLMERGVITHLALNGAGAVHDFEVAFVGETSEEVADGLLDGSFGMSEDTGRFINGASRDALEGGIGFGEALGARMEAETLPFRGDSLIHSAWRLGVPLTLHVALGTDIIHPHPDFDAEATGWASGTDFRIFCASVAKLTAGAVYCNIGSAVVLPEVFLKALTAVRNLGYPAFEFQAVNLDMKEQYRTAANVLSRPSLKGGRAFSLVGHHEIMLPLIFGALLEELSGNGEA